jgi:hypothetical protein
MNELPSQREVLLSASLYRLSAQLAAMARDLDELQTIARDRPQPVVIIGGNVTKMEKK